MAAPATLPPALIEFIARFNRGEYWSSHEALEEAWRENRSGFYHGLILFASALVHFDRLNAHGVTAQFEKAERRLEAYRPSYLGLDVDRLLGHARACRDLVGAGLPQPPFHLDPQTTLIRGTEPELEGP